jgi:hypothetical protein
MEFLSLLVVPLLVDLVKEEVAVGLVKEVDLVAAGLARAGEDNLAKAAADLAEGNLVKVEVEVGLAKVAAQVVKQLV